MTGQPAVRSTPRHVSVVAVSDATVSTLFGIYDVMSVFERMDPPGAGPAPFHVEIVGERVGPLALASGAGSGGQNAIGIGVLGGVLAATFLGILFVPLFFVLVRKVFGRKKDEPTPASTQVAPAE